LKILGHPEEVKVYSDRIGTFSSSKTK